MDRLIAELPEWSRAFAFAAAAVIVALGLHRLIVVIAGRAARRTTTQTDDILLARLRGPSRWLLVAIALSAVQPALDLTRHELAIWERFAGLLTPAILGWVVVALLGAGKDIVEVKADITVEDNLRARRRRTRVGIFHRIAAFIVITLTICLMLISVPSIRAIGVTLIASAGLAALAVGAAAQPALKNLIAGFQMAFTEPIRLDDVVIMDNEWGRIEEIRLTYVVVRIWDDRRLVVPVSKFLEDSFQNWTRSTSQLLGSVFWYLDPAADVPRLREKLGEIVRANPRWDGRFFNLQITDMKNDAMEVRALMTAKDAAIAFDLRCDVREALLDFIRTDMPEAILRRRADVGIAQASPSSSS